MRTICTAVLALACAGALAAQDAKKYDSKDGKFSAKFPGEPKTQVQKTSAFDLTITLSEKGGGGFAVIYSDFPAETLKATTAKKLLEGGQDGLVTRFKATVSKSTETTFKAGGKEYPARDIWADKDKTNLRVRLILVESRLYQIFVAGPKELVEGKETDEFFESFEVTK
jgi:hypothetical protein